MLKLFIMNPYANVHADGSGDNGCGSENESNGVSYSAVATRLLQDNFLLTALELHTELVESGRELPQLREFFSNPGNFEHHVSRGDTSMHRTPSQATLDSLDLARYSEDGGGGAGGGLSSEVAVLEFELRKARETINSLRANLTQFADCNSSDNTNRNLDERVLKPHEKRALNFLVNEYLLLQSYKLTAITFSDENPDQDFEDWDDIGLNVSRPCGLISLYLGELPQSTQNKDVSTSTITLTVDAGCQTDVVEDMCVSCCQTSFSDDTDWNHEILVQAEEIVLLKQQVLALETDKVNYQKLYDAALASLNSLTTPISESPALELNIPPEKLAAAKSTSLERIYEQPLNYSENHYGSNTSTHSLTPEQFEMIECEKNVVSKEDSQSINKMSPAHNSPSSLRHGSVTDDALSLTEAEWTRVHHADEGNSDTWTDCALPSELKMSLLRWCGIPDNTTTGHDLLDQLISSDRSLTTHDLLPLAAETLIRIVPHTLVSRRCEAAALLAALSRLSPAAALRPRLVSLLLTLLKKPDEAETKVISEAACYIVRNGGTGEVLSCIAELLTSRSVERRLLAANLTLRVTPNVPVELCTSLLLSLVVLMCEAGEVEVRAVGVRAAALVCAVGEHKYTQVESLVWGLLRDPTERVRTECVEVLVPLLARCAIKAGNFSTELCHRVMLQLAKHSHEGEWKDTSLFLDILRVLVVPTLAYVVNVQIVKDSATDIGKHYVSENKSVQSESEVRLNLQCYMCGFTSDSDSLVVSMNALIKEDENVRWPEVEWFLDKIIHQLLDLSEQSKLLNHPPTYRLLIKTFNTYCKMFGEDFTTALVLPVFSARAAELEKKLETLQPVNAAQLVSVGTCLAAVMPCCNNHKVEIPTFLKKWVVCSSVCALPVDLLAEPLKWLATHAPQVLTLCLQCLNEMVGDEDGGVGVCRLVGRLLAALADDLSGTDIESLVLPTVTALLSHTDSEVRSCGVTALGAVTRLGVSRALPCADQCWGALEAAASMPGGEAAAADALAMLLAPDVNAGDELALKVLSVLCVLCDRAPLTADVLSSLLAGLQLAVHFARPSEPFIQSTLLPALRRLEQIDSPSLQQHKQAVEVLITSLMTQESSTSYRTRARGSDTVGRRVTQIFQQSKTNMNIPNIFKKKS